MVKRGRVMVNEQQHGTALTCQTLRCCTYTKINERLLGLEIECRAKPLDPRLVSRLNWYGELIKRVVLESRVRRSR